MEITYLLSIVAFDSIVIIFAVLFGAIPGNWYKWRIEPIQVLFAVSAFLTGTICCIWTKINEEQLIAINSLYTFSFQLGFEVLYLIILLASLFRFGTYLKTKRELPNRYIKLNNSEYKITNKLEYTLGNLIYMPNVKAYAIARDMTIVFSGSRPKEEIDAGFICKKIGDGIYECLSYVDLRKSHTIKSIINTLINCLIIIVAFIVPVVIALMDATFINTGNVDSLYNVFEFLVLFLLGSIGSKLFANVNGFGKLLYFLFIAMTIISFYYLF